MNYGHRSGTTWLNGGGVRMRLHDVVSFRRDLLFNGAVQVGWVEEDPALASRAAEHFVFHGPSYHGVPSDEPNATTHRLVDTASLTHEVLSRLAGNGSSDPFMMAIAGYGTGKSHLAVMLSMLLSDPTSRTAQRVVDNLRRADSQIGDSIGSVLRTVAKPFLVVTINGMKDFDLSSEITRQILHRLSQDGLDTTPLENLRPRFGTALHFLQSFFEPLREEFGEAFGATSVDDIIAKIRAQDEETFAAINEIYHRKMGSPIHAVGQESLHDFVRVTNENYCGAGKHYKGLLILFDEFGRYLEFSVQKPHIAGSGALQQLFECVQANGSTVMLVCFIQYELKAYISRVAPELRDDLIRYVTRYDSAQKVRLSTNIETLIANLLDKKETDFIKKELKSSSTKYDKTSQHMKRWFPDLKDHALWNDKELFYRVVCEGCWPLHPLSVWTLYKLTTIGKSLQQRSALSLLAEVYDEMKVLRLVDRKVIAPVDLCNESLISEFLSSERFGQQGALAHAYEAVLDKYEHELGNAEIRILKSVLLSSKLGASVGSKEDSVELFAALSDLNTPTVQKCLHNLEKELAVLEWNEQILRYEITGDSVPKRAFLDYLQGKVEGISASKRAGIFAQNYKEWVGLDVYRTDFGAQNEITTQDWHYTVSLSDVRMLKGKIDSAVGTWRYSFQPNEPKGQLIYCYVGPNSDLESVKKKARNMLESYLEKHHVSRETGAPIAIVLLYDQDGRFGCKLAEYWILDKAMDAEERSKYQNFIAERKQALETEMRDIFAALEKKRHIVVATEQLISPSRTKSMLTRAFGVIYPKTVPFDFDGFNTVRGNAAKDTRSFTNELIMGRFDREWISTLSSQKRNRAHKVFVDSWGVLDHDGTLRLRPTNKTLREIIDMLADRLIEAGKSETGPLNLGEVMETLCSPPYGCNVASAGLILALFIGSRRNEINLLKDGVPISIENWLTDAMPKNFFDLSVLVSTHLVKVSGDSISEWESLLEDWDLEDTIGGALEYQTKASELQQRVAIPPNLYYKHKSLSERTDRLRSEWDRLRQTLTDVLGGIEAGKVQMDLNLVSCSGSVLVDTYNSIVGDKRWGPSYLEELEKHLADTRAFIQQHLDTWLPKQKVHSVKEMATFSLEMNRLSRNLEKLGLLKEKQTLIEYMSMIEEQISEIENAARLLSDIASFVASNVITSNTKIVTLKSMLQQIEQEAFFTKLQSADNLSGVDRKELAATKQRLAAFQNEITTTLDKHFNRMMDLYDIEQLDSADDIAFWRNEVADLIILNDGEEQDLSDLIQVQQQLDLIERHFRLFSDMSQTDSELAKLVEHCVQETEVMFSEDAPPLQAGRIYDGIYQKIRQERKVLAKRWIEKNLPDMESIRELDASEAQRVKSRLEALPVYLSESEESSVRQALVSCEERLDELEVEGLLARYSALSPKNRRRFLEAVSHQDVTQDSGGFFKKHSKQFLQRVSSNRGNS